MAGDVLTLEGDRQDGEPLLQPVMQDGRRLHAVAVSRRMPGARAARELARLPEPLRQLGAQAPYPVEVADALVRLARDVDLRLARHGAPA